MDGSVFFLHGHTYADAVKRVALLLETVVNQNKSEVLCLVAPRSHSGISPDYFVSLP